MPIHGIRPTPTSLSDFPAAGLFLKNGQPLSVPPRNRKTPNGNSIGGFLFTFTRERVSRRNHNARSKTPPNFLGRIATPFQTKRNFQNVSKRRRERHGIKVSLGYALPQESTSVKSFGNEVLFHEIPAPFQMQA